MVLAERHRRDVSVRSDLKSALGSGRPPSARLLRAIAGGKRRAGRELLSTASFSSGTAAHLPLKELQVKSLKQVAPRPSFRSRGPSPGSQELLLQI